jgi:hypothetical protein
MRRVWLARLLIGLVFCFNVQCALMFCWQPQSFAPAYALAGVAGRAAVQGFGVLFLMWNVPYALALWQPVKNRVSLGEAVVMQTIGVIGEAFILGALPATESVLRASIFRFVGFDSLGLLCLAAAAGLVYRQPGRAM